MLSDRDRQFALTHVPRAVRAAVESVWALDEKLGEIVARTTQPMVGQMRLTWWYDALTDLKSNKIWGEPILDRMTSIVAAGGDVDCAALAKMVEGWEALLDPLPLDSTQLALYAEARGAQLFAVTTALIGGVTDAAAGRGWALSDFSNRCSDPGTAATARAMARTAFAEAQPSRLPRALRILSRLARADVDGSGPKNRPLWHMLWVAR